MEQKHTQGIMLQEPNEVIPTNICLFVGSTLIGNVSRSDVDTGEEAEANAIRIVTTWNEYQPMKVQIQDLKDTVWAKTQMVEMIIKEKEQLNNEVIRLKNLLHSLNGIQSWLAVDRKTQSFFQSVMDNIESTNQ